MRSNSIGPELAPHKTYIAVVYILFVASLVMPFVVFIGIILAYVKRGEVAGTLYGDHLGYVIRTFWMMFFGGIIGLLLIIFGGIAGFLGILVIVGYLLMIAASILFYVRSIYGLIKFSNNEPVDPVSWLI